MVAKSVDVYLDNVLKSFNYLIFSAYIQLGSLLLVSIAAYLFAIKLTMGLKGVICALLLDGLFRVVLVQGLWYWNFDVEKEVLLVEFNN